MTERDAHFTVLLNSSIEETRTSGKALPFLLARVRTIYYWLTNQKDLAPHEYPGQLECPTSKISLLRFDAEHAVSQYMFEFEAFKWFIQFESGSEKEMINFIRGYSFYADLEDAKTYYFENSPPSLAKLDLKTCAFEHCVFLSFQFRYGRFPILSMTDTSCANHIECFLCGECVHILCFYCLFLKLLIEFHLGRSMNWPKFDSIPQLDGIIKFLNHCRKLVNQLGRYLVLKLTQMHYISANCGLRLPMSSQETLRAGFTFLYFLGLVPDFSSETSFKQFEHFGRIDEGPFLTIADTCSRPYHDFRVIREVYRSIDYLFFEDVFSPAIRDWNHQASSPPPITFHQCTPAFYLIRVLFLAFRQSQIYHFSLASIPRIMQENGCMWG